MTFDIALHEVCVRVGGRTLRHNQKISRLDSLPNFLTHGAPLRARFALARAPLLKKTKDKTKQISVSLKKTQKPMKTQTVKNKAVALPN